VPGFSATICSSASNLHHNPDHGRIEVTFDPDGRPFSRDALAARQGQSQVCALTAGRPGVLLSAPGSPAPPRSAWHLAPVARRPPIGTNLFMSALRRFFALADRLVLRRGLVDRRERFRSLAIPTVTLPAPPAREHPVPDRLVCATRNRRARARGRRARDQSSPSEIALASPPANPYLLHRLRNALGSRRTRPGDAGPPAGNPPSPTRSPARLPPKKKCVRKEDEKSKSQ